MPWWTSPPDPPPPDVGLATDQLLAELRAGSCSAARVQQLLAAGARCHLEGGVGGDTAAAAQQQPQPLHVACANERLEVGCALAMLEAGAEPNGDGGFGGYGGTVAVSHTTGASRCFYPITAAARRGSLALVQALINHGASVNPVGGADRHGPLFWAVALGHEEVCEALLLAGAMLDSNGGAGGASAVADACLSREG